MSPDDARLLKRYRTKRMQRSIEYILLSSIFIFFLISFREYYRLLFVASLFVLFLLLNYRLTMIREARRATAGRRVRLTAEVVESILFLLLILTFSFPVFSQVLFDSTPQEHYSLVASILLGIFLGGLTGEVRFQTARLREFDGEDQVAYMRNLKRTIILPYIRGRSQKE